MKKAKRVTKSKSNAKAPSKKQPNKIVEKLQIDPETLKDLTKDLKDVFRFWNGDVYVGQFSLTTDLKIIRQGQGKYFTSDGCVFSGRWEDDVLVEAERMSYHGGSWYRGPLEGGLYTGQGHYQQPSLGVMTCSFMEGRPLGRVTLTDKDEKEWQGDAVEGVIITLLPRNHFFDSEDQSNTKNASA